MKFEPIKVEYVNHMGSDLTVVDAARVSFDKRSEFVDLREADLENHNISEGGDPQYCLYGKDMLANGNIHGLSKDDFKLIRYLANHKHWSPFGHATITVRVTAPIFLARQLYKHKIGLVENEISRRYVSDEPTFFKPNAWRGKPTKGAKQGSDGTVEDQELCNIILEEVVEKCNSAYEELLLNGVAPEQARLILPQNMNTSWHWTGSLEAFCRVYRQRVDSHAQQEAQEFARALNRILFVIFPASTYLLNSHS